MAKTKILIIDDHADTRLLVSARIKKHQHDTVFASDARQAIAVAQQTQPDAIVLNLSLPGGSGVRPWQCIGVPNHRCRATTLGR